jgi:AcrR family transcriptional regulator
MSDFEIRDRILEKAQEHFLQYGFSTVTMNEIAGDLGMSKKTVYAHFPSKEALASEMVKRMHEDISVQIDALVGDDAMDFLEKLKRILQIVAGHHSKLTPHFRMDLQKHAPQVCKCTDDFQHHQLHTVVSRVIQQGIDQGAFRRDLDRTIITSVIIAAFQSLLKPELLTQEGWSIAQVLDTIRTIMFEGILTNAARSKMRAAATIGLAVPS